MQHRAPFAYEPPQRGKVPPRREAGAFPSPRRRGGTREPRDAAEADPARKPLDRHVVRRGVETCATRTERTCPGERTLQERRRDTAPAVIGIDAQAVEPRLTTLVDGELRDTDDLSILHRDPEPAPTVTYPFVEHVEDVIVAPDAPAERFDIALVGGPRGTDQKRVGHAM